MLEALKNEIIMLAKEKDKMLEEWYAFKKELLVVAVVLAMVAVVVFMAGQWLMVLISRWESSRKQKQGKNEGKNEEKVLVMRLHIDAKLPTRGSLESAGLDLYALEEMVIQPEPQEERARVRTGIAMKPPPNTFVSLRTRSGMAAKGINVVGGVCDRDYRGEYMVLLSNDSGRPFTVRRHDRIAQAIIQPVSYAPVVEVSGLDDTARGAGGFGSTDSFSLPPAPAPLPLPPLSTTTNGKESKQP